MSNHSPKHDIQLNKQQITKIKAPDFYYVILNNDDYTPMEFVVDILMRLFGLSYELAYSTMLEVHHNNQGIAGRYPKEIAIEKANVVHELANANDFPLSCRIEKA